MNRETFARYFITRVEDYFRIEDSRNFLQKLKTAYYFETVDLPKIFFIAAAILSPFSLICCSVHNKLIDVETHRLIMVSLAVKSLLTLSSTACFRSCEKAFRLEAFFK